MKFVDDVIGGNIIIFEKNKPKKKEQVKERLEELGYPKFLVGAEKKVSYKYITSTGLFSLTKEEVDKLRKMLKDKKENIQTLEAKTPPEIWNEELDAFMKEYNIWENDANDAYANEMIDRNKNKKKSKIVKKNVQKTPIIEL